MQTPLHNAGPAPQAASASPKPDQLGGQIEHKSKAGSDPAQRTAAVQQPLAFDLPDFEAMHFDLDYPPLTAIRTLRAKGVPADAIAGRDFPKAAHVVFLADRPLFDFAGERGVDGDGNPAIVFLARNELDEPIDLIAWQPSTGLLAAYMGAAPLLGMERLWLPRLLNEGALEVFETPLEWLRGMRAGVVVVDQKRAAGFLREAGKLFTRNPAFGELLADIARADEPEILVPRSAVKEVA